jgi:hypothetical protein
MTQFDGFIASALIALVNVIVGMIVIYLTPENRAKR